jgi:pimeloyl-ACP methyl ester carboxylesterase
MAPVARELSLHLGVLEPLQTKNSLEGQVQELKRILEEWGNPPLALVGYSWGAWLAFLLAARHPKLVQKLILVSSSPFEEIYAPQILENRLSRLDREEREEVGRLQKRMKDPANFARFGELMSKADFYDPLPLSAGEVELRPEIYEAVWPEGKELRKNGLLLQAGNKIECPVVAIHGDHDPHPAEGVEKPLSGILKQFRFVLLKKCGHTPWMEKQARDQFFEVLRLELG